MKFLFRSFVAASIALFAIVSNAQIYNPGKGGTEAGAVSLTNVFTLGLTNVNPVTSNLVNYGGSLRSEGYAVNSFQAGSNANATAEQAIAIGNESLASGLRSIAIGYTSMSSNESALAIGNYAASTLYGTAIGNNSRANTNAVAVGISATASGASSIALGSAAIYGDGSIAIGQGIESFGPFSILMGFQPSSEKLNSMAIGNYAYANHSNSTAFGQPDHFGNFVVTTTTNQIRLGTTNHSTSIPGRLGIGTDNTSSGNLVISSGVITSSLPAIDISQTWSNSGVAFTGLRVNVTNLGSASSTLLADFQTNGTSQFFIDKNGINYLGRQLRAGGAGYEVYTTDASARSQNVANRCILLMQDSNIGLAMSASYGVHWSANAAGSGDALGSRDLSLLRDAAATLQLGADAATATAQTLKAHDGSGTDKAGADLSIAAGQGTGAGAGGSLNFKTAPAGSTGSSANSYVTRMSIDSTGLITGRELTTSNLTYLPVSLGSAPSTVTIDLKGGSMQYVTMTNNTTIALTNVAIGRNVSVMFIGPTDNQYNLIMPSGIRLYSGAVTNIVTTNKSAVVSFTSFDGVSTNLVTTVAIEP